MDVCLDEDVDVDVGRLKTKATTELSLPTLASLTQTSVPIRRLIRLISLECLLQPLDILSIGLHWLVPNLK